MSKTTEMHHPSMRAALRMAWLLVGLALSIIPFFKSLAFAAFFFGVLALQGVSTTQALARSFAHVKTLVVPAAVLAFLLYWFSTLVLGYQFARGRSLSRIAGACVGTIATVVLLVGQPWQHFGEPIVPGEPELLHIAFLLSLALYAVRAHPTSAPEPASSVA